MNVFSNFKASAQTKTAGWDFTIHGSRWEIEFTNWRGATPVDLDDLERQLQDKSIVQVIKCNGIIMSSVSARVMGAVPPARMVAEAMVANAVFH